MEVFECAVDYAGKIRSRESEKHSGHFSVGVVVTNATSAPLRVHDEPYAKYGRCAVSFSELAPGQSGVVRFSNTGDVGGAVALASQAGEHLLIGATKFAHSNSFSTTLAKEGVLSAEAHYHALPGEFQAAFGATSRLQGEALVVYVRDGLPQSPNSEAWVILVDKDDPMNAEDEAEPPEDDGKTFSWMWGDVNKLAKHDPLRWSARTNVAGVIKSFEQCPANEWRRPVVMEDDSGESQEFINVEDAITTLRGPQVSLNAFKLEELDGLFQLSFLEWCRDNRPDLLADALFLGELHAVRGAMAKACNLEDQAVAMDLLIACFVSSPASLSTHMEEVLAQTIDAWRSAQPPGLAGPPFPPPYHVYANLPIAQSELQAYIDAQRALLSSACIACSRKISSTGAKEACGQRRAPLAVAAHEAREFDPPDRGSMSQAGPDNSMLLHSRLERSVTIEDSRGSAEEEVDGTAFLTSVVRQCIHTSAEYSLRRRAIFEVALERAPPEARGISQRYLSELPVAERSFRLNDGGEGGPRICFESLEPEVFANLDNGTVATPELLLASLGFGSKEYKSMATNSKSGEFFFFSGDGKFLIKTVTDDEGLLLHSMMPGYQNHLRSTGNSLIVRYAGLFHFSVDGKFSKYFTVMASVFDPTCQIHETFDVKGSLFHRKKKEGESIGKDEDWFASGHRLQVRPPLRAKLLAVHEADAAFLQSFDVMDYSLLVGIHNMEEGEPGGSERRERREGGGIFAVDERKVYFVGLIDFLIGYGLYKQGEHLIRVAQGHGEDASCVSPLDYAMRQAKFVEESVMCPRAEGADRCGDWGSLKVLVVACHNLCNADGFLGTSDPYVRVSLGFHAEATPTVNNDLNPEWNCELALPVNAMHLGQDIEINVYDDDGGGHARFLRGADDSLGSLTMSLNQLVAEGSMEWKAKRLEGESKGEITLRATLERVFTRVTVIVRSLKATYGDKKMDPFVELRYGRGGARTQVKKNGGRETSWEESIGPLPLAKGAELQCAVKDFDTHNKHELIGEVQPLVLDELPKDAEACWEGTLDLVHEGESRGQLFVKIQFLS